MEYLNRPQLVSEIQQFFGVKLHRIQNGAAISEQNGHAPIKLKDDSPAFTITSRFWYNLFRFGTELGDELFYSTFIPFVFWNIDGTLGRKVILVWALVMYTGQACKDILKWPRPGPPVVKLAKKWSLEYGMPSTHAMVAISIPFSVYIYAIGKYDFNLIIGFMLAFSWCALVCVSRVYLGMHTVLDICGGLLLSISVMSLFIPLVDYLDYYLLRCTFSPLVLFSISVFMLYIYPSTGRWTPTRNDTALVFGVSVAVQIGAWINQQEGLLTPAPIPPPYSIVPTFHSLLCALTRTILGFALVFIVRAIAKFISYRILCYVVGSNATAMRTAPHSQENKRKIFVDLGSNYYMTFSMGIAIVFYIPFLFRYLGIEREMFLHEI